MTDKGYLDAATLELAADLNVPTYIPEPKTKHARRWTDKPPEYKRAVYNNRRRTKTTKNQRLQRGRSEKAERSFAHIRETGGARRTWLRGLQKVRKRSLISAVARTLGLILRGLEGCGLGLREPDRDATMALHACFLRENWVLLAKATN